MARRQERKTESFILSLFLCLKLFCTYGSHLTQHNVRPATRIVDYNSRIVVDHNSPTSGDVNNLQYVSTTNKQEFPGRSQVSKKAQYIDRVEMNDNNGMDVLWHVSVDTNREHNSVAVAFNDVKRRSVSVKETLQNRQNKSLTFRHSIASFVRKLLINEKRAERSSGNNQSDTFVGLTDESGVHLNDTVHSTEKQSSGFNVSTQTEYNVSGTVEIEPSSGKNNSKSNDTSTVIVTKAEPCSSIVVTGASAVQASVECNATIGSDNKESGVSNKTNATSSSTMGSTIEASIFRPIRIRAILSDVGGGGQHLAAQQRVILLTDMLRPALLAWSAALRVKPVQGNLTVDASQLNEDKTCGPDSNEMPNVAVPLHHMALGVADTDLIVYIGLSFTQTENEKNNSSGSDTTTSNKTENSKNYAVNAGYSNDAQNYASYKPKEICAGDYVAASTFCSTDQVTVEVFVRRSRTLVVFIF
jgi:Leishmanolysin